MVNIDFSINIYGINIIIIIISFLLLVSLIIFIIITNHNNVIIRSNHAYTQGHRLL